MKRGHDAGGGKVDDSPPGGSQKTRDCSSLYQIAMTQVVRAMKTRNGEV